MKTQQELQEELRKKQVAAHKMWLDNPTTQLLIKTLKDRSLKYQETMIAGVMIKSDKEVEDKLRACITTCEAIVKIVTDSDTFVEQSKQQQTTTG
jgi:hypothetical protein